MPSHGYDEQPTNPEVTPETPINYLRDYMPDLKAGSHPSHPLGGYEPTVAVSPLDPLTSGNYKSGPGQTALLWSE